MSKQLYEIRGLDSLMFRDGKPFSDEEGSLVARSLSLPMPGTVAGFLRTLLGNQLGWDWTNEGSQKALKVSVVGPLLLLDHQPVFPAPLDAVIFPKSSEGKHCQALPLLPSSIRKEGCNLPGGLYPLALSHAHDDKPDNGFRLWKWEWLKKWLENPRDEVFASFDSKNKIGGLPKEQRVHVAIDPKTGISREGMLYTTEFLCFEEHRWGDTQCRNKYSLLMKVGCGDTEISSIGTLGGEMRLAAVERAEPSTWPNCPEGLKSKLGATHLFRMQLATPAIFSAGWKPGWLDENLEGSPPFAKDLSMKLVSAAVGRREAVSGWDYAKRGPKPVRWLAPAGSVYFLELLSGDPAQLAEKGWLTSISDDEQDRLDGYGLAIWGVYENKGENK